MDAATMKTLTRKKIQSLAKVSRNGQTTCPVPSAYRHVSQPVQRDSIRANAKTELIIAQLLQKYPRGVPRYVAVVKKRRGLRGNSLEIGIDYWHHLQTH